MKELTVLKIRPMELQPSLTGARMMVNKMYVDMQSYGLTHPAKRRGGEKMQELSSTLIHLLKAC